MTEPVSVDAVLRHQASCRTGGVVPMMRRPGTGEVGSVVRAERGPVRGVVLYDVSGHHGHLGFFVPEAELGGWRLCAPAFGRCFPAAASAMGSPGEGI